MRSSLIFMRTRIISFESMFMANRWCTTLLSHARCVTTKMHTYARCFRFQLRLSASSDPLVHAGTPSALQTPPCERSQVRWSHTTFAALHRRLQFTRFTATEISNVSNSKLLECCSSLPVATVSGDRKLVDRQGWAGRFAWCVVSV